MIIAIQNECLDIIKLLLNHPKININKRISSEQTALITATLSNSNEIVDLIIKNEKFDPVESHLNYAFYVSIGQVSKQLYEIEGLDVNINATNLKSQMKIMQWNLSFPSKGSLGFGSSKFGHTGFGNYGFGNSGNTFGFNNTKPTIYLGKSIKYNGLSLDDGSKSFNTPLINAVDSFCHDKIDLIINHPSFDKDKSQLNFAIALSVKKGEIVAYNKLSKLNDDSPNIIDSAGNSLLSEAILNSSKEIIDSILNDPKFDSKKSDILNCFVQSYTVINDLSSYYHNNNNGDNENQVDKSPITIMNQLCEYDKNHLNLIDFTKLLPNGKSFFTVIQRKSNYDKKICDFLLEHGCDPNEPDEDGIYPLSKAISIDSIEFVNALIDSGKVDLTKKIPYNNIDRDPSLNHPNRKIPKYTTYLHLAVMHTSILSELLSNDFFDVNITDELGDTPLMLACRFNNKEAVNIISSKPDLDYLHCNNDGKDALRIINPFPITELKNKNEYISLLNIVIDKKNVNEYYKNKFGSGNLVSYRFGTNKLPNNIPGKSRFIHNISFNPNLDDEFLFDTGDFDRFAFGDDDFGDFKFDGYFGAGISDYNKFGTGHLDTGKLINKTDALAKSFFGSNTQTMLNNNPYGLHMEFKTTNNISSFISTVNNKETIQNKETAQNKETVQNKEIVQNKETVQNYPDEANDFTKQIPTKNTQIGESFKFKEVFSKVSDFIINDQKEVPTHNFSFDSNMLKENKKELSSSEDTNSSFLNSILQNPKIQNNEKPRFRKHQKRIPKSNRSFQKQVEEVITDVFNDADEDKVEQLSKSLSKFTARMISQKARKLARSYIDDDDDDDDYDYDDYSNDNRQEQVLFYPHLSPFDQNIMMMQQQQQWFQMIQMNTQRQAQINMQMMYQNQMNHVLKKNTKKRNKK